MKIAVWAGVACVVVEVLCAIVHAGVESVDGSETDFWKSHSVILAQVKSVAIVDSTRSSLTLLPIATLTGQLDSAEAGLIEADVFVGWETTIQSMPKNGTLALFVLVSSSRGRYMVAPYNLAFMPNGSGLLEVLSLQDPKAVDLISRLRELRKKR